MEVVANDVTTVCTSIVLVIVDSMEAKMDYDMHEVVDMPIVTNILIATIGNKVNVVLEVSH